MHTQKRMDEEREQAAAHSNKMEDKIEELFRLLREMSGSHEVELACTQTRTRNTQTHTLSLTLLLARARVRCLSRTHTHTLRWPRIYVHSLSLSLSFSLCRGALTARTNVVLEVL